MLKNTNKYDYNNNKSNNKNILNIKAYSVFDQTENYNVEQMCEYLWFVVGWYMWGRGDCSCMNALKKQKYALKINNNIQNNLNKLNYFK